MKKFEEAAERSLSGEEFHNYWWSSEVTNHSEFLLANEYYDEDYDTKFVEHETEGEVGALFLLLVGEIVGAK